MRRYMVIAVPVLALLVVLYVIGSAGGDHTKSTSPSVLPPGPRAAATATRPAATPQASTTPTAPTPASRAQSTTVITASRINCRWRQYRDGALGADPSCAPGKLNPAVTGNTAQTICSQGWLAATSRLQPPPTSKNKLLIEYQLPGNPITYALARVVPVEDGGSPTSPLNLYPLPLNGYGGQQTQTLVANQLHDEICAHKITVAQAAKTLEGDWLAKGLPQQ